MFKEFQKEDGTQCSRLYCYFWESDDSQGKYKGLSV